jgi:hypothetical protein
MLPQGALSTFSLNLHGDVPRGRPLHGWKLPGPRDERI